MKYQYLEMDSNKWQNGAITNEGNKQLDLPAGFKGYVRLQINTAGNVDEFPATTLQIQSFSFWNLRTNSISHSRPAATPMPR